MLTMMSSRQPGIKLCCHRRGVAGAGCHSEAWRRNTVFKTYRFGLRLKEAVMSSRQGLLDHCLHFFGAPSGSPLGLLQTALIQLPVSAMV